MITRYSKTHACERFAKALHCWAKGWITYANQKMYVLTPTVLSRNILATQNRQSSCWIHVMSVYIIGWLWMTLKTERQTKMIPIQIPKPTWQDITSGRDMMMVIPPSLWSSLMAMKLWFCGSQWCKHSQWESVGPSYAASLEPLGDRRNLASFSLFYRYYFGGCSSELGELVPLPCSRGRSTRYSQIGYFFCHNS